VSSVTPSSCRNTASLGVALGMPRTFTAGQRDISVINPERHPDAQRAASLREPVTDGGVDRRQR
jgi:hypothetical protein